MLLSPWADGFDLPVLELRRIWRGQELDLWDSTVSLDDKSIPLPVKFHRATSVCGRPGFD